MLADQFLIQYEKFYELSPKQDVLSCIFIPSLGVHLAEM